MMRYRLTDDQQLAVARRLVALAVQMAPGREGEALHAAIMYWLDEDVIDETDPATAHAMDDVTRALARLGALMQIRGGVPGKTRGRPAPTNDRLHTGEEVAAAVGLGQEFVLRRVAGALSCDPTLPVIEQRIAAALGDAHGWRLRAEDAEARVKTLASDEARP